MLSHLDAEVKAYRETFRLLDYTPGVIFPTESILERLVLRHNYDSIFLRSLFHSQKCQTDCDKQ